MQRNKLFTFIAGVVAALVLSVSPVYALSPQVSITQLPAYITSDTFKISYSGLTDDPASITAQFYVNKNGGGEVAFGPVINGANGQDRM